MVIILDALHMDRVQWCSDIMLPCMYVYTHQDNCKGVVIVVAPMWCRLFFIQGVYLKPDFEELERTMLSSTNEPSEEEIGTPSGGGLGAVSWGLSLFTYVTCVNTYCTYLVCMFVYVYVCNIRTYMVQFV